jgi:hypothetical protein
MSNNVLEILKEGPTKGPTEFDTIQIPAMEMPAFRTSLAVARGAEKNILFRTWGGIGDQICSEPTLRYAIDRFKGCQVSLESDHPELFSHLKFHEVYDSRERQADRKAHLVFETITTPTSLSWQFISHMITHCVDCPSLNALRCQLPISYKQVQLAPQTPRNERLHRIADRPHDHVIMHFGKHWESKTYPVDWCDAVYDEIVRAGLTPVLIGKDTHPHLGVVDSKIDQHGIDLRNRTSLNDSVWLCQKAGLALVSDSSPLHMAVTGDAYIAFLTTAKHPDYITHYRRGGFGWRMQSFQKGGIWDVIDICPNKTSDVNVDKCDEALIRSWLPEPKEIVEWLVSNRNS